MNDLLEQLLLDCSAAPGGLGCGVRLADRANHVCSFHKNYPAEGLEKMMLHLATAMALLASQKLAAPRYAWSFGGGKVYVATRPDGAIFSLVTHNDEYAVDFFDRMARRFDELQPMNR